jgi:CRP/FNR family transcriptional regulator
MNDDARTHACPAGEAGQATQASASDRSCPAVDRCPGAGTASGTGAWTDCLVATHRHLARGDAVVRAGDRFRSLYTVCRGFLKSTLVSDTGREQVLGFHMAGDLLGLEGICTSAHTCDIVALDDTELCVLPYDRIEEQAREAPRLQAHLRRLMSREIVREHGALLLLGSLRADERLAVFLLDLSRRFASAGLPADEFVLRMTRADIANFLGITLETASRTLSRLARRGLIQIRHRQVRLADRAGLQALAAGHDTGDRAAPGADIGLASAA